MIRDIAALLAANPVFAGLGKDRLEFIAGCGWNVQYRPGAVIYRFGEPADRFLMLREGTVSVEVQPPTGPTRRIETMGKGEVLGWSWLFPPHVWQFDTRALTVVRATAFDGACIRDKCDQDPSLGYELMKRFAHVVADRLQATRLRVLDLYGAEV
ncbi:MAG: cyclic nucleotide-binding domain-containing protein [Deinococcales bacterium]